MHARINTHPIVAGAMASGPTSQIIARSGHGPIRAPDIADHEFDLLSQKRENRDVTIARVGVFHRSQFVGNPSQGLHGTVQKKFEPAFMEAHDRLRAIASRVHSPIYGASLI
jgi:hypothetical protein